MKYIVEYYVDGHRKFIGPFDDAETAASWALASCRLPWTVHYLQYVSEDLE